MTTQISTAVEEERRRIAQGLHDDVGQTLAAATLRLHELRLATTDDERTSTADEVERLIRHAIDSSRNLTFDLRLPMPRGDDFESTLHDLAARFVQDHRISCLVDGDLEPGLIGADAANVLYSIVCELLHNVAKHAHATEVTISLRTADGCARLALSDDGQGIDSSASSGGFGLTIARESVAHVGGSLSIQSAPDGTTVTVVVPAGAS